MKSQRNILIAFILNISFSIFELVGGFFTGSVAIMSDAIHDFGDAISIGLSYFLEKKSQKKPDSTYTYGYVRYSVLGALITTCILIIGSTIVIYESIQRLIVPVSINYNGMIVFAIFGTIINFVAAYFTKDGDSLNQKSVNLHMLEDVLGWIVVLIGAIIMKFTNISWIDSIMSLGVALFITLSALKNFKSILDLFLEKSPTSVSIDELKKHVLQIPGILDVHHIHVWSMDGYHHYATMHIVTDKKDYKNIKNSIREELEEHGIIHVTIEIEAIDEKCDETCCKMDSKNPTIHHHHHH